MRTFFDSSALAKRYVSEPGTDRVLVRCQEASEVLLATILVPELISAFNRLRREGSLDAGNYQRLKADLAADVADRVIDLTPVVIGTAVDCLERFPIRTLDALHVAAALVSGADRFVSSDYRQCEAARQLGLNVEEI